MDWRAFWMNIVKKCEKKLPSFILESLSLESVFGWYLVGCLTFFDRLKSIFEMNMVKNPGWVMIIWQTTFDKVYICQIDHSTLTNLDNYAKCLPYGKPTFDKQCIEIINNDIIIWLKCLILFRTTTTTIWNLELIKIYTMLNFILNFKLHIHDKPRFFTRFHHTILYR